MPYRILASDDTIEAAVRRIASEQIDRARRELADDALTPQEKLHQARKRIKKLRALIRLFRPALSDHALLNDRLRDLAAPLSALRDAEARIEARDRLRAADPGLDRGVLARIRRRLTIRRKALERAVDLDQRLAHAQIALNALSCDAAHWTLDADGFEALAEGLEKTLRQARRAMKDAQDNASPEPLHRWRKRTKAHWYHTRLLADVSPAELRPRAAALDALGEMLGEERDLSLLQNTLAVRPDEFGAGVDAVCEAMETRRTTLQREAFPQGVLLFAERPSDACERWAAQWADWRG